MSCKQAGESQTSCARLVKVNNQSLIPSTDVIQVSLTLKMTTAKDVETSVTVNNSPIQDYDQTDDHAQPTYKDNSDNNNDNEIDDEENTDSIQHVDNMDAYEDNNNKVSQTIHSHLPVARWGKSALPSSATNPSESFQESCIWLGSAKMISQSSEVLSTRQIPPITDVNSCTSQWMVFVLDKTDGTSK